MTRPFLLSTILALSSAAVRGYLPRAPRPCSAWVCPKVNTLVEDLEHAAKSFHLGQLICLYPTVDFVEPDDDGNERVSPKLACVYDLDTGMLLDFFSPHSELCLPAEPLRTHDVEASGCVLPAKMRVHGDYDGHQLVLGGVGEDGEEIG